MEQHQDLIDAIIADIDGECMKRDWNLMAEIFSAVEDDRLERYLEKLDDEVEDELTGEVKQPELFLNVIKHLEMLVDSGYIKGVEIDLSVDGLYTYGLSMPRITLAGYDFADIVRDKTLLKQTMGAIKKAGYMVSWETLKQFAPVVIKKAAQRFANKILNEENGGQGTNPFLR